MRGAWSREAGKEVSSYLRRRGPEGPAGSCGASWLRPRGRSWAHPAGALGRRGGDVTGGHGGVRGQRQVGQVATTGVTSFFFFLAAVVEKI